MLNNKERGSGVVYLNINKEMKTVLISTWFLDHLHLIYRK